MNGKNLSNELVVFGLAGVDLAALSKKVEIEIVIVMVV